MNESTFTRNKQKIAWKPSSIHVSSYYTYIIYIYLCIYINETTHERELWPIDKDQGLPINNIKINIPNCLNANPLQKITKKKNK